MKVLLHLSFVGTEYCGYQIQPNGVTVQQRLNEATLALFGYPCDPSLDGVSTGQSLPPAETGAVIAEGQAISPFSHCSISSIASPLVSAVNISSPLA